MAVEYYRGTETYAIFGVETSFGAGATPASANKFGKVTNISYSMTNNVYRTQSMGDGRNATVAIPGAFDISGNIAFDIDDFNIFTYVIGKKTGNGILADPYEITELENIGYTSASEIPTLEIEFGSDGDSNDDVQSITGCAFNSATITMTQGDTAKGSIEFIGKTITTSTSLTSYALSTNRPFVFWQGSVTIGTDTLHCVSYSLTINNNIQTYRNIGDRFIAQPVTGLRRYDFTITMRKKYDSTASVLSTTELRDLFYGLANSPIITGVPAAQSVSLDISEGSTSGYRVVNIDLENCYFENWSEPITLEEGVVEITVTGFGLAGLTDGSVKVPIRYYTIA